MNNLDWKEYAEKRKFRVVGGVLEFSHNENFKMLAKDFIICCSMVEELPVGTNSDYHDMLVGVEGEHPVYLARLVDENTLDNERILFRIMDGDNIQIEEVFLIKDLQSIMDILKNEYEK